MAQLFWDVDSHIEEIAMSQNNQHEIWNPFCERVDGLSATERADMEISRAWAYYARGGGGDPYYFDYPAWLKNAERQHSR